MAAKHKPRDGFGKAILIVAVGHEIRRALDLRAGVAHRDAETTALEHRDIISAVTNDGDLRWRNSQQLRKLC